MEDVRDSALVFFVNGRKIIEKNADPEITLLTFLRRKLTLTGSKLGCGEGGCGACTVMISRYDWEQRRIVHSSANACLTPLCSMHGLAVTTVEGIGSARTRLHPVQERLAAMHGSQCGFCTPGIVMSMYTLLRNKPKPSREDIDETFQGNLCRCTGYRPILEGMATFSEKSSICNMGEQCCRNGPTTSSGADVPVNGDEQDEMEREVKGKTKYRFLPYDASQEPSFPSELQLREDYLTASLVFKGPRVTWFRPSSMAELLNLKATFPDVKLVNGNTEIGVEMKLKHQLYPILVSTSSIPELKEVYLTDRGLHIGASTTLTRLEHALRSTGGDVADYKRKTFVAMLQMLKWFAGPQIRNVATLGGNISTASPISDLNPLLVACGAVLHVISKDDGERQFVMDDGFFVGYRKTSLRREEILKAVLIPYTRKNEFFHGYKQSKRRDDDIAIVNAGMRVLLSEDADTVQELSLSFGGMAATTVSAKKTMARLIGRRWDDQLMDEASVLLAEDLPLSPGTPGGMEIYRRTLTVSFFFKFYLSVKAAVSAEKLHLDARNACFMHKSATKGLPLRPSSGSQIWETSHPDKTGELTAVGKPLPHLSGITHTTGEAVYVDDMPPFQERMEAAKKDPRLYIMNREELQLALVTSTEAHARILKVDTCAALEMPGVVTYIDYTDVPGKNLTGAVAKDEEIFASEMVTCQGQVIGGIVAKTSTQARQAAHKVKVAYEPKPTIITIEDAIETESYYEPHYLIEYGDFSSASRCSEHVVSGEIRMGGQEHFYLETQATVAVPRGEDGDMEIFCSCQSPSEAQMLVADALDVGAHKITIRVKRMGGGFGGKQTRYATVLLPVAVAAAKLERPVRCALDRDVDMVVTGTRHPYLGRYRVGFTGEGRLDAVDLEMFSNAGNSADLSSAVLEKALLTADNAYRLPNARIAGHLCRTNLPSCTAFRGFGGPQGAFMLETIIQHVAEHLGRSARQVRALNLYEEGDETPYRMLVENANVRKCWNDVIAQSDFERRSGEVMTFNRDNRWKKRGITIIPTKFGIAFTERFFNQAGALVNIYNDGTVLVCHGGTEMGQGLHTKMVQVASNVLSIPISKIHINETSTTTVPNVSPTAASSGSDLNGMAVMIACQQLMRRLEPYKKQAPTGTWEQWVEQAYLDRVSLSATGFYKTPEVDGYDWESKGPSQPYAYFTSGAAVTEVEIDCLTGDHVVLRTDIVMDIGQSINPSIDVGQIEGGFVQGYGLFTLEEQCYSPEGFLYTRGPGSYKIPGFGDIPQEFNVTLLKGVSNPKAVYSSKAVGEPPLLLGMSALFAIKEAIHAARKDAGLTGYFRLDSPATAERIRMACQDRFTEQFPTPAKGTYKPWTVNL